MKTAILLTLFCFFAVCLSAGVISREEALRMAFPGAVIESKILFLTEDEMKEAEKISGSRLSSALVTRYTAKNGGALAGIAYLDTHTVRTKKESLMVMMDSTGKVKRIEVVAFLEPKEYLPPDLWYSQFQGKILNDDLRLERGIRAVTGATLTAKATTDAVRRAIAIEQVLKKKGKI